MDELLAIMARLRGEGGCPWDRAQTHLTLRAYAIEEAYELVDAIELGTDPDIAEELGDLLLQVVFHAQMASERGAFNFADVCRVICDKMLRRHPHVFGDVEAQDVETVWRNWERIKREEKEAKAKARGLRGDQPSVLDGLPEFLPALLRAEVLLKKARKAGLSVASLATPPAPSAPASSATASVTQATAPVTQAAAPASPAGAVSADSSHSGNETTCESIPAWSRAELSPEQRVLAVEMLRLVAQAQSRGWSAEELLRAELRGVEKDVRRQEAARAAE